MRDMRLTVLRINVQLALVAQFSQKQFVDRGQILLGKLPCQPFFVVSRRLQIVGQHFTVHDHDPTGRLSFDRQGQIVWCHRALGAARPDAQVPVRLQNSDINGGQVKISLSAAFRQEFAQIHTRFFHVAAVNLTFFHQNQR